MTTPKKTTPRKTTPRKDKLASEIEGMQLSRAKGELVQAQNELAAERADKALLHTKIQVIMGRLQQELGRAIALEAQVVEMKKGEQA